MIRRYHMGCMSDESDVDIEADPAGNWVAHEDIVDLVSDHIYNACHQPYDSSGRDKWMVEALLMLRNDVCESGVDEDSGEE